MRPVNLIPPEQRRDGRAPLRTGALPYVVLGALALAVAAVAAVALTSKQIADREAEIARLEAVEAETAARAEALAPYAQFATLSAARHATVLSLAQSRFDWERVLRELALVIPADVWLTEITASAAGAGDDAASGVTGPSLTINGCGNGHEAVAAFQRALEDIDGVTRVGIMSSEKAAGDTGGGSGGGGESSDCRTRNFIAQFEVVVAFDAVAVPPAPEPGPAPPSPPAPSGGSTAQAGGKEAAPGGEATASARGGSEVVAGVAR